VVLAILASRSEKCWLEALDRAWELKERRKELPRESKAAAIKSYIANLAVRGVRGLFMHALVNPTSTFRITIARDGNAHRPSTLMLTYALSLKQALAGMDDDGPLPSKQTKGQEFAFQEYRRGITSDRRFDLECASELQPDAAIRKLLSNNEPVVLLEAVTTLAPRNLVTAQGFSGVVRSELVALFRDAKARGQAVVFMLGGEEPTVLAEKVYLRPPFTDYGLRCGYLRWRGSAGGPWARQKPYEQRVLLGLQLP
jgi:hypothetical protein